MFFVIIGVLIIAMNLAGIGWVASWNWEFTGDLWKFCVPFGLAALWWLWADKSGLNKRREIEKMEERKSSRRKENLVSLGLNPRSVDKDKRKADAFKTARQREVDAIEGERAKKRKQIRDSVLSGMDSHSADQATPRKDEKR